MNILILNILVKNNGEDNDDSHEHFGQKSDDVGENLKAVRDDVAHNNCSLCVRVLSCFHYHFHNHLYDVDQ